MYNIIKAKFIALLLLIVIFTQPVLSQNSMYVPRNILKAYDNRTRSFDGKPGEKYWQNSADYKISVSVVPSSKTVVGTETIKYFNNSPDTLNDVVIRLYQNIFKYGSDRDFPTKKEALTDGVKITEMIIGNQLFDIDSSKDLRFAGTNLFVKLKTPIVPDSSVEMSFQWNFQLSSVPLRMGVYDSTSFFIAYWYPQIAVYDDIDGWDRISYSGQTEFYNDFNNYDVRISVPNNFAVWSTGVLQNPSEVLTDKILGRYNSAHSSDTVVHIVTKDDLLQGGVFKSSSAENVWHYKADHITDFAFAISDHYLWDAVGLTVDSSTNRRVYIAAVYKEESKDFFSVAEIARKSIDYLSKQLPGVPFPFPSLTVFNGSGGMEFPMMVNDGSSRNLAGTVGVTSHEITHEYFPFYMGINERKYAWMDEGMATFLPFNLQARLAPDNNPRSRNVRFLNFFAGNEAHLPLMTPSYLLKGISYSVASYSHPGMAYDYLRDALGEKLFDTTLREYMNRWNGKHPIPFDFFNTFNSVTGQDLSWFFIPWFFEKGYPDLAIKNASVENGELKITIRKKGSYPVPVDLKIIYSDSSSSQIYESAAIWSSGKNELNINQSIAKEVIEIELGNENIVDVNTEDNKFVFKK